MTTRLWALDGARLTMDRAELVEGLDPGPVTLVVPSFLVAHDEQLVLIDTGLAPDAARGPVAAYGARLGERITFDGAARVDARLAELGFVPEHVGRVVLTHGHFDHTGGLRLFSHAEFLAGAGEREPLLGPDEHGITRDADVAPVRTADWRFVDGDHDVFGDGTLVLLALPGHTPGNLGVLVRLPGRTILLAGDTTHLRSALHDPAPMPTDTDRATALASLHRMIDLARAHGAELWVTHDPDDWADFGAPGEIGLP